MIRIMLLTGLLLISACSLVLAQEPAPKKTEREKESAGVEITLLKQWSGMFPRQSLKLLPREAKQDIGAIVDADTFRAVWQAWSDETEGAIPVVDFDKHFVLFLVRDAYEQGHTVGNLKVEDGVLKFQVGCKKTDTKYSDKHPAVMALLPRQGIRAFDTGNGVFELAGGKTELPTVITEANYKKIVAHEGKWTEQDVLAVLGPPRRYSIHGKGKLNMIWEDVSRIRIEFEDGKATFLWGEISKHFPSKKLTLDNFRRLYPEMSLKEARAILGPDFTQYTSEHYIRGGFGPFDDLTVASGTTLCVWQKVRRIVVQFSEGKVSGYSMTSWLQVKD